MADDWTGGWFQSLGSFEINCTLPGKWIIENVMSEHQDASALRYPRPAFTPDANSQGSRHKSFSNRCFIRNYSKVAAPLTKLTSSSISFSWTPEADQAFNHLKNLFTSAPVLVQPDPSLQFVVEVDASNTGHRKLSCCVSLLYC